MEAYIDYSEQDLDLPPKRKDDGTGNQIPDVPPTDRTNWDERTPTRKYEDFDNDTCEEEAYNEAEENADVDGDDYDHEDGGEG